MSMVFNDDKTKYIYIAKNERENVILAVNDLISDIKKVCGNAEITDCKNKADIFVCTKDSQEFNDISGDNVKFSHKEEFCYRVQNDKLYLFGDDDLGTSWAIYTFLEKELKIPPFYIFEDIEIEKKQSVVIEDKTVQEYPHTRFRGWFINDEDLLSKFKSKGKREIAYAFYHDVVHPELMSKIVETALRFRINLIIPASFLDILKPDQENLVKEVSRRGLYVSQHHLEPLGVSHFGYADFVKDKGCNPTQSYITNREPLLECWNTYVEKWAKYPRVIWQLGLRGAGDIPVWKSDSSVGNSLKERGELLSNAIKTQYDIVKEHYNGEIYSTCTVWMEGAKLLQSGYLTLPENTISVFADIGMSQMFGDDFFTVPREENRYYGIYYHSQYWHTGPHLAEAVLPQKIDYCYDLARRYNSDYYAILNASNVKEFTFSINLNSKFAWYGEQKSLDQIIDEYCELYALDFANELKDGILRYYQALGDVGEDVYYDFCKKYDFNYHKYHNLQFPVCSLTDGIVVQIKRTFPFTENSKPFTDLFKNTLKNGLENSKKAYDIFTNLQEKLPAERKNAILKQWRYQSFYWYNLFCFLKANEQGLEEIKQNNLKVAIAYLEKAVDSLENVLSAREKWFTGVWKTWFTGDEKLNIKDLRNYYAQQIEIYKTKI